MKLRTGKNGQFYGCIKYPECRETTPAVDQGPSDDERESLAKYVEKYDPEAEMKHDAQQTLDNISMEETKKFEKETESDYKAKVEDKPMTSADWNVKGYEKSWGVFSAGARKEGASPKDAIRDMHLWEWMDSVHGDEVGYPEWKEGVNRRVGKQ